MGTGREDSHTSIERRLTRIGALLVAASAGLCWALWGLREAGSCLAGGLLAAGSVSWLSRTVASVLAAPPPYPKRRIITGYVARLLLIPLGLYAMLRLRLFSLPAVVAGFAAFNLAVLVEGILEAVGRRPDSDARAE